MIRFMSEKELFELLTEAIRKNPELTSKDLSDKILGRYDENTVHD